MNQVIKDFIPYKNVFGMYPFTIPPNRVTQNDTLFTAYALMAIIDQDALTEVFKDELFEAASGYMSKNGATLRAPNSNELDSNDNLVGWGILAFYIHPLFAENILLYARLHGWIWPHTSESIGASWLGRHVATRPHLQLATRKEVPDFFGQAVWCASILWSIFPILKKNDQDAFSLSYCLVRVALEAPQTPWGIRLVAGIWKGVMAFTKRTMKNNLESFGWLGSPHANYIK